MYRVPSAPTNSVFGRPLLQNFAKRSLKDRASLNSESYPHEPCLLPDLSASSSVSTAGIRDPCTDWPHKYTVCATLCNLNKSITLFDVITGSGRTGLSARTVAEVRFRKDHLGITHRARRKRIKASPWAALTQFYVHSWFRGTGFRPRLRVFLKIFGELWVGRRDLLLSSESFVDPGSPQRNDLDPLWYMGRMV